MAGEFSLINRHLSALADTMSGTTMREILTQAGVEARPVFERGAESFAGADRQLRGFPRAGKMGVGFDTTAHSITFKPRPYVLWILGERGRRPTVAPKRRKGVVKLGTPWGARSFTRAEPLHIGGTRGHRTLTIARERVETETPRRVFELWRKQLYGKWGAI